jgi:hypothetical protein
VFAVADVTLPLRFDDIDMYSRIEGIPLLVLAMCSYKQVGAVEYLLSIPYPAGLWSSKVLTKCFKKSTRYCLVLLIEYVLIR